MKTKLAISMLIIATMNINAAHHEEEKVAGQGLISSEIFDLGGEMDLYVEKYASCGANKGDKHMHPYGTLVYMLDGQSNTNVSGEFKPVIKDEYWFEDDAPAVADNECRSSLVIRVAKKGEAPTVFVK
jgi:hypothetical protein